MKTIRAAIVDDSHEFRESLATFLKHAPGFEPAEIHASAADLLRAAETASRKGQAPGWDLVLMDIEMPQMDGIEATRRLRALCPEIPVVMLTVFEDPKTIVRAISAGANGYVLKKSSARELASQLRSILEGGAPVSPSVAAAMLELVRSLKPDPAGVGAPARLELTDRERDVLRSLVHGHTYQEAADELGITLSTVRTHVRAIYSKLQVHSVAQAIRKALEAGLT
jgi:DNA-binding NarL/FixJ family response regulator